MILDTDRIRDDGQYREELRHRCITDHLFLAELIGFTSFEPRIHQPAVDLYFPKNPNLSIEQQHAKKFRLHLDPRGTFKTTLGRVDSLQWVLAFPEEITILNETATQPLAREISAGIAVYFWQRMGVAPTLLQLLYPELCVFGKTKPDGLWDTPVRRLGGLDHTLAYTSPRTSQSGWHPWVECIDDMVDTENSGLHASAELRQSVIDTYYTNKNTLRHGGYISIRGTRYHPFDLYGNVLNKMDPEEWEVLIRGALSVRNGMRLLPGEFPDEDDVILHFAELPGMDYSSMRAKFYEHYETFMCQQQNDPQGGHVPTFDEALYKTMLIPPERIPAMGDTYLCWRLPYARKGYMSKYAEGAVARVWEGKVDVIDCWQGMYTPSRLAEKIVRECKRHQVGTVMMEYLPGIQYIETHIRNEAARRNVSLRIQWLEFQEDDNDRFERIRNMEPQARAGRIRISTAIGKQAECKTQLLNFGLVTENGIADCMSRLAAKVPASLMRQDIEDEEAELQIARRHAIWNQFVYHPEGVEELESRQAQKQMAQAAAVQSLDNLGLQDILGGLDG
jgi:hypothetical protein